MKATYRDALRRVLAHEGGYVNDPHDPGGATNKGVTQATYDAWRRAHGAAPRDVLRIEQAEVESIYRRDYWDKVRGDDLPAGVDYVVFDFAVNSGPERAARYLQMALGETADGIIGPVTIAAAARANRASLIDRLCDDRLSFMRRQRTWWRFGRGWQRRVQGVRAAAKGMAA